MAKRIATYLLVATVCVFLIHFLLFWMNANVDSYFYWALGEYFRTGQYPFTSPFIYTKPTTISPPLYGLFFVITHGLSRADIILHALQLGFLAATSYFLYRLLRLSVGKIAALIISCGFALFPINLVYATYVLTENPSQFLVALWLFCVVRGVSKKRPLPISAAVLIGSIATLLKYNLVTFMMLTVIALLPFIKKLKWVDVILPILAVIILSSWVVLNHRITGVWGLYDTRGTQLYNQFIAQTKILPPEDNPAVRRMRSLVPPGTDIAVPYWDIQGWLSQSLHGVWKDVDQVLFDVAWASVATHPREYIIHSIANFGRLHYDHVPHWRNIGNMGKTGLSGTDAPYCSVLGSVSECLPIIMTPWSYVIWNAYVGAEMDLFERLAQPVFYLLLFPSLGIALFFGGKLSRLYAAIYLTAVAPIAFTIHPDPRYIVPFYPIAVLIITTTFVRLRDLLVAKFVTHR